MSMPLMLRLPYRSRLYIHVVFAIIALWINTSLAQDGLQKCREIWEHNKPVIENDLRYLDHHTAWAARCSGNDSGCFSGSAESHMKSVLHYREQIRYRIDFIQELCSRYGSEHDYAENCDQQEERIRELCSISNDPSDQPVADEPQPSDDEVDPCEEPVLTNRLSAEEQESFKNRANMRQNEALTDYEADRTAFESPDEAGLAAIHRVNASSIAEDVEYAGNIYQDPNSGQFFFSEAVVGDNVSSLAGDSPIPDNMVKVGEYHTHSGGFNNTDENFSPKDMLKSSLGQFLSYVGTPQGKVLKYEPIDSDDELTDCEITNGAGNISLL